MHFRLDIFMEAVLSHPYLDQQSNLVHSVDIKYIGWFSPDAATQLYFPISLTGTFGMTDWVLHTVAIFINSVHAMD